jgi:Fe-S-cluster containining protein
MSRFKCDHVQDSCKRCGECCRFKPAKSLTKEEEKSILIAIFRGTGFIYPYGLATPGLAIQSYEKGKLETLAHLKGIKLNLRPNKVLHDAKRNLTIVFDWVLACDECPFLKDGQECIIYEERFDICRLFPDIGGKLQEVEKRHSVVAELIKSGELVMPSADNYPELCALALNSEMVNFDEFVEINDFED